MRSSAEDRGKRPFLSTQNHFRVKKREELREEGKKSSPAALIQHSAICPFFFLLFPPCVHSFLSISAFSFLLFCSFYGSKWFSLCRFNVPNKVRRFLLVGGELRKLANEAEPRGGFFRFSFDIPTAKRQAVLCTKEEEKLKHTHPTVWAKVSVSAERNPPKM